MLMFLFQKAGLVGLVGLVSFLSGTGIRISEISPISRLFEREQFRDNAYVNTCIHTDID